MPGWFGEVQGFEEALAHSTGERNRAQPHVTAAVFVPLARPMPREQALRSLNPEVRDLVADGTATLVAVAHGKMVERAEEVTFILYRYVSKEPGERPDYYQYDATEDEFEIAVLMNGDGTRYCSAEALDPRDALARWAAGFLLCNDKAIVEDGDEPIYRLRYALINPPEPK
jgi:hypothetical protein